MRILLTRAEEDCRRSARFLARLGCEAICAPLIETHASGEPPPAGPFDALVVTSAKGAAGAKAALEAASSGPVPVFAVGPRTARALGALGVRDVHASGGDASALLRDIPRLLEPPARLLHVAGRDRKPEPAAGLVRMGYDVAIGTAYAAEAVAGLPEPARAALAGRFLDAALHYSPRTARLALALVEKAGLQVRFAELHHVAISPDVAEILRKSGLRHVSAASAANEKAMFRVLLEKHAPAPEEGGRVAP